MPSVASRPTTLLALRESGWKSKTVKQEIRDNFLKMLREGSDLFPGIIGYESTVIPEINIGLIAGHDMLFLGEKGQAKSRLMRSLVRFLDEEIPYLDLPGCPVHEDPYRPITSAGKQLIADTPPEEVPIAWWPREERYAERLAPGTKFADIIGEIDPAKLAGGTSMSAEEALHFGLIPRMHRGIFAMNEVPELDELVQVGLFNILEERDVQIRGYPIQFDIDVLILFSANPATYNRSGKVIPAAERPHRLGDSNALSARPRHRHRDHGAGSRRRPGRRVPGRRCPYFMKRDHRADQHRRPRKSKYVDQQSGVSRPLQHRQLSHDGRPAPGSAACGWAKSRAVPRISDLGHLYSSSLGKLELDMMGSHQMSRAAGARSDAWPRRSGSFSRNTSNKHGLDEIADDLRQGREDRSRRHAAVDALLPNG